MRVLRIVTSKVGKWSKREMRKGEWSWQEPRMQPRSQELKAGLLIREGRNLMVADTPFSQEEQRDSVGTPAGAAAELRDLEKDSAQEWGRGFWAAGISDGETKPRA